MDFIQWSECARASYVSGWQCNGKFSLSRLDNAGILQTHKVHMTVLNADKINIKLCSLFSKFCFDCTKILKSDRTDYVKLNSSATESKNTRCHFMAICIHIH